MELILVTHGGPSWGKAWNRLAKVFAIKKVFPGRLKNKDVSIWSLVLQVVLLGKDLHLILNEGQDYCGMSQNR